MQGAILNIKPQCREAVNTALFSDPDRKKTVAVCWFFLASSGWRYRLNPFIHIGRRPSLVM